MPINLSVLYQPSQIETVLFWPDHYWFSEPATQPVIVFADSHQLYPGFSTIFCRLAKGTCLFSGGKSWRFDDCLYHHHHSSLENQSVFAEGADVRVGDGKKGQKKVHGGQKLIASAKSFVTKECSAWQVNETRDVTSENDASTSIFLYVLSCVSTWTIDDASGGNNAFRMD